MKRFIIFMVILVICCFAFILFKLSSGLILPSDVKKIRIGQLRELRIAVEQETKVSSDYDDCLYKIYKKSGERRLFFSPTIGEYHDLSTKDQEEFYDIIDYSLYHQRGKWYIVEKKADRLYPHLMLIDEAGAVYEIKKIKQEEK